MSDPLWEELEAKRGLGKRALKEIPLLYGSDAGSETTVERLGKLIHDVV